MRPVVIFAHIFSSFQYRDEPGATVSFMGLNVRREVGQWNSRVSILI
jgi:hypothetical protein